MSTNFHLDSPHNEAGHLGKSTSSGFIAKAGPGIDSFDDWAAQLAGRRIFTETGTEISAEDLLTLVRSRALVGPTRRPRRHEGEWVEQGVLFVRHDFC